MIFYKFGYSFPETVKVIHAIQMLTFVKFQLHSLEADKFKLFRENAVVTSLLENEKKTTFFSLTESQIWLMKHSEIF